jgi:hypothetical protein
VDISGRFATIALAARSFRRLARYSTNVEGIASGCVSVRGHQAGRVAGVWFASDEDVGVERLEYFNDGRVELSAALDRDLSGGFVDWPGVLIGPAMRERVEYVSHRNETTDQRDRGSRQPVWVTIAVPALVV